jgi:hypothetical protein
MAASLAFTTLLGTVPLFTVALAYVARFPVFERWLDTLEPFLVKFLLPDSSSAVRHYLAEFTTKAAGIQGVGTVFLIITAVLLVAQVERVSAIRGIMKRARCRRMVVMHWVSSPCRVVRRGMSHRGRSGSHCRCPYQALSLLVQPAEIRDRDARDVLYNSFRRHGGAGTRRQSETLLAAGT